MCFYCEKLRIKTVILSFLTIKISICINQVYCIKWLQHVTAGVLFFINLYHTLNYPFQILNFVRFRHYLCLFCKLLILSKHSNTGFNLYCC